MNPQGDILLTQLLQVNRTDASQRHQSLGPLVETVVVLRATTEAMRALLNELDTQVGTHLELLDAVIRSVHGNRWFAQLSDHAQSEGGQR